MKLTDRTRKNMHQKKAFRQLAGMISPEGVTLARNLMQLDRPPPPY